MCSKRRARSQSSRVTLCAWLVLASGCGASQPEENDAGAGGKPERDGSAELRDGRAGDDVDYTAGRNASEDPTASADAGTQDGGELEHDAAVHAKDASDSMDASEDPDAHATEMHDAATQDSGFVLPPATLETLPYAREVVSLARGPNAGFGQAGYPQIVLGPPMGAGLQAGSLDVLSLGVGGSIVLGFGDYDLVDGPGADLIVFENAFWPGGDSSQAFAEPAEVAVSSDGETWHVFDCNPSGSRRGCAGVAPVLSYDALEVYPLDPELTGGDRFDLEDLGLERARYVRITDLSASGDGNNAGFDLDAVGLVHFRPTPERSP
jgi:hypothetical protein